MIPDCSCADRSMPLIQSPGGGASASACAAGAAAAGGGVGVAAGGGEVCAFAAGATAAMAAARSQGAAPIGFLFSISAFCVPHSVLSAQKWGRRTAAPHIWAPCSEDLFAVQHEVETFAFLLLADAQ